MKPNIEKCTGDSCERCKGPAGFFRWLDIHAVVYIAAALCFMGAIGLLTLASRAVWGHP